MKKLLLLAFVIAGLWQVKVPEKTVPNNLIPAKPAISVVTTQIDNVPFICDGREYCNQMISYEEAIFFNKNCPDTKMVGDNDTYPCEGQFAK